MSRDRGTDYAAAAREAAPQARQIADQFHLVRNLADALEQLLARCRSELRQAQHERVPEGLAAPARPLPHPKTWQQQPPQQMEREYQVHRTEREERFRHIMLLRAEACSSLRSPDGLAWESVVSESRVKQGGPPLHHRPGRRSLFDPYAAYVLERWQAGIHDGQQVFEEIRVQGFKGSARLVRRFLQTLREKRRPWTELAPPQPFEQFSARKAVWLFIREQSAIAELQSFVLGILKGKST